MKEDYHRYIRAVQLAEFGSVGQQRLRSSAVLVVGAGALGSVVAMYLAASGVGRIGICDFDNVDITNLQRQLSYSETDIGLPKVVALASRIKSINSEVVVEIHSGLLRAVDMPKLFAKYDVIVEGSDNPDTKYAVADAAQSISRPYTLGGVAQWRGQVMSWRQGHATYRDIFPTAATPDGFTPCSVGGVFGPAPGIVGSIQAAEAIKLATEVGEPLLDRLLLIDTLKMRFHTVSMR